VSYPCYANRYLVYGSVERKNRLRPAGRYHFRSYADQTLCKKVAMPSRVEESIQIRGCDALIADQNSDVAVLVTHPWGLLGGDMHNNVVNCACLYFQKLGISTLRFNFCGSYQLGRGCNQVRQLQDIANDLLAGAYTKTVSPTSLILVGYSYGALIAASASAGIPQVIACISISPPFSVQHWLLMFSGSYHLEQAAKRDNLPRLLVMGDRDNFTSVSAFQGIVDHWYPADVTTGAIIKAADHFFRNRERDIMDVIGLWLQSTFPQCNGELKKLRLIHDVI
jgi:alpha/beta superfamily hydrolase